MDELTRLEQERAAAWRLVQREVGRVKSLSESIPTSLAFFDRTLIAAAERYLAAENAYARLAAPLSPRS